MVDARKGTNVREDVLKGIRQLEGVDIAEAVPNLSQELGLVTVDAHKGTNVREDVLKGIRQLEGVDVAEAVPDLSQELGLVTVDAREGTNMCEDVLKGIRQLEGINIARPVLDMGIDDELHQAQNLSTQVESIPETRLLPLFRGQRPIKPIVNKRQCGRIYITYFTGFKFIL
jgi:hypothetical protein